MAKLAFPGLEQMSTPMAARPPQAGHNLTVWNRTGAKTEPLVDQGAVARRLPGQITLVDAPVRRSVPEATAGRLAIYVGANPEAFARVEPLFAPLGTPHLDLEEQ